MSMLAERRGRKQKQSLNPRGKWWADDHNKFGQRMLEKMGWTKGKGLGANEQGITEYSSMPYKDNTAGIGYDGNFEAWTEHQEKFSNFLQQFQENQNQDTVQKLENQDDNLNAQSIELKSKQSHARVHYQKFTRGKDTNKYKSKDLANIFGEKDLIDKTQIKLGKYDNIYEKEAVGTRNNRHGVVTINGGSMTDYFKLKSNYNDMTDYFKFKSNSDKNFSSNTTDNQAIDSNESENEQCIDSIYGVPKDSSEKSNYAFDNPCLGLNSSIEANTDGSSKKSAKKRKKFENDNLHMTEMDKHNARKKVKIEVINCKNGFTNPALNLDMQPEEDCNGKEFEISRAHFGLENCGLDLTDEKNNKKRVTFNDQIMLYKYDMDSIKKKKGKTTLDKYEVENKKQKRKRKLENITTSVSNGFINEALDVEMLCEEVNDNELNEHKSKKNKKRKICKITSLETIQESPENETEINIESEDTLDISIVEKEKVDAVNKKSKKKKKKKETKNQNITVVDITSEELDIEIEDLITDKKVKRDKENNEGDIISKKCKKEKKKNKKNRKIEKHTIQTEISSDEQNVRILDQSKQQQNDCLIENENKDAAKIETYPVITIGEEEQESLENIKQKKKKKKSIDKDSRNEISAYDAEKEISDKENAEKEQNLDTKKLTKKDKKRKKTKNKNLSETADSSNSNIEVADVNTVKQEKLENAKFTDTPSKKNKVIDAIDNIIHSPWSAKARMSKKMLITLFHNNALLDFPGSNIKDIKGYGVDVEC